MLKCKGLLGGRKNVAFEVKYVTRNQICPEGRCFFTFELLSRTVQLRRLGIFDETVNHQYFLLFSEVYYYFPPFYRKGNLYSEWLNNLPKVTKLISGRGMIQPRESACRIHALNYFILLPLLLLHECELTY